MPIHIIKLLATNFILEQPVLNFHPTKKAAVENMNILKKNIFIMEKTLNNKNSITKYNSSVCQYKISLSYPNISVCKVFS